jgi:4-deoxy-L-threo-5-hexosulose-uronate ketol-isomerase
MANKVETESVKTLYVADREHYRTLSQSQLRAAFLLDQLFQENTVTLHYSDCDRVVVGGVYGKDQTLELKAPAPWRVGSFCARRELGVLCLTPSASVIVNGQTFTMAKEDILYVGQGENPVVFAPGQKGEPFKLYLVSYPAHQKYPTRLVTKAQAECREMGSLATSNHRFIRKYIHPEGAQSCQLVMGVTELTEGSVWNTMPPHLHERRSEVYFYFDQSASGQVFHMMGVPDETRHIPVGRDQAVISPSWSIHAGAGTEAYRFAWAMGGENQAFDDMDPVAIDQLR